jgi:ABC-type phosphate transport system substrate-binding protein
MKLLLFLYLFWEMAAGAEYSVIVSKKTSLPNVTSQQIRDIFLMKRHAIGNQRIIPINLLGQDSSRIAFESAILKMDRDRLNAYWIKQHFQGITPPITQSSYESVKMFVQNVEGSIGYIPSSMVDSGVKVLYEF